MGVPASAPPGSYVIGQLPPSTATILRACINPGAPYLPQCWNAQVPPAFDAITVAAGGSATADFCLGDPPANPTLPITGLRVGKSGATAIVTLTCCITGVLPGTARISNRCGSSACSLTVALVTA